MTSEHGVITVEEVLNLLADNERDAAGTLNMVASENTMSAFSRLPLLLDLYNRYLFNVTDDPDRWHFRGAQRVGRLETELTIPLLLEMAHATHTSVRPLSGLSAMTLVLGALAGPPGSAVVTIDPANGGHYATADVARRLGLEPHFAGGPDPHELDYDAAARLVARVRPPLVYVDQSHCLFPIDVARLVRAVRAVDERVVVHVDASHWMGLVLGGAFPNPLDAGADSFAGSTHKTFPGPQKAVFLTRRADLADRLLATEDYLISSHHLAATVGLGLALLEFRDHGGARYARAVLANTRRFAELLTDRGLTVAGLDRGFSAGHQLWVDTEAGGVPAKTASDRLFAAGIRVNYLKDLPGFSYPALRLGLNEPTWLGLAEPALTELVDIFVAAVRDEAPPAELAARTVRLRRSLGPAYGLTVEADDPMFKQLIGLLTTAVLTAPGQDDGVEDF